MHIERGHNARQAHDGGGAGKEHMYAYTSDPNKHILEHKMEGDVKLIEQLHIVLCGRTLHTSS